MVKNFLFGVALALAAVVANSASASIITFSQADLVAMSVYKSDSSFPAITPTMNIPPTYIEPLPAPPVLMTGLAGSSAFLGSGLVAYKYNGPLSLSANDVVQVVGYNDNDDVWDLGIWFDTDLDTTNGISIGDVVEAPNTTPGSATPHALSYTASGSEKAFGVFIRYNPKNTGADAFHASWGVPEATSVAVWGGLSLLGMVARRRRG